MVEWKEVVARHEAELKAHNESKSALNQQQVSGLSAQEKKELFDALDLLK